ncbi:hypothetical protein BC835DRAFT_1392364 [Cytidiella melzeri]|nr:hypothetical protein BC835DRAFT_1392364 [Cytidiella melzeri]
MPAYVSDIVSLLNESQAALSICRSETDTKPSKGDKSLSMEEALELAKRAFALKKYEEAVDHYATVLELVTAKHGDKAPETADMYFAYGKALLENAIAQSSVLGKDQTGEAVTGEVDEDVKGSGAFLSFSGDVEEGEDAAEAEEEDEDGEDGEDGEEPEDDFGAAWEAFELARAIFEKQQDADDETKLKLAETYILLGDVSLETEKFEEAIQDYSAGLELKLELLPQSSRQIAEAHYKLSIVLDLSSGRLQESIMHAEKALESVEARLAELRNAENGQLKVEILHKPDSKGKGKAPAKGPRLLGDDCVGSLTKAQTTAEIQELEGLKEELALKVEEQKTVPNEAGMSAPAMVAKSLDSELNVDSGASVAKAESMPVNDLTSVVKKKKKPAVDAVPVKEEANASSIASTKRKAEDSDAESPSDKKVKLEDVSSTAS